MRNLVDAHNHSQFSFDGGRTSVERCACSAFEKGLGGVVITDHYDAFVPEECLQQGNVSPQDFDIAGQQAEISRVQEIYGDRFLVLKGIEIGMNEHSREDVSKMLAVHDFDQVLASIHYLEDTDPYYGGYFIGKDYRQAYGNYLETIYKEMTALQDFDIAGHYDYVARYAPYPQDGLMYRDFSDIFDAMFRYLIENGKGFELNTKSCTGSRGRKTTLDRNILIRYRELGGEIISLGSDSHIPGNVGEGFAEYAALLKSLGFRWTSHYEKRKLVQLPL